MWRRRRRCSDQPGRAAGGQPMERGPRHAGTARGRDPDAGHGVDGSPGQGLAPDGSARADRERRARRAAPLARPRGALWRRPGDLRPRRRLPDPQGEWGRQGGGGRDPAGKASRVRPVLHQRARIGHQPADDRGVR